MRTRGRSIVLLAVLSAIVLAGCGSKDAATAAVTALEKQFRSGDVIKDLSASERVAFSRLSDGFRSRGRHVVEGMGVQYRFVRVEAVRVAEGDLMEPVEGGEPRARVQEGVLKRVKDGEIAGVAEVTVEVIPSRKWLEENASVLVLGGGAGPSPRDLQRAFTMVQGKSGWSLATGEVKTQAGAILRLYRDTAALKDKVSKRELAERLITDAPKVEPAPQG
ncbi:MAG: hypothetical protein H6811_10110 [Phycisphaeraceae bacterium]|nr:hypothetical protein [Phycisphaeraceae bacterium]